MFGLNKETIEKINAVFQKHPEVEEVIIYGSRAKGNHRAGSDIDITLKGKYLDEKIRSTISLEIDDLNTPYLFDISILEKINNPELLSHIKQYGRIFFKKQH
jgi:predicted nucleotidyltransferase